MFQLIFVFLVFLLLIGAIFFVRHIDKKNKTVDPDFTFQIKPKQSTQVEPKTKTNE